MYELIVTGSFKKDLKTIVKRGYDLKLLDCIIAKLIESNELPKKCNDHSLSGNWMGYRECHITPDWLLVYKVKADILVLTLTRTGTHSDLF